MHGEESDVAPSGHGDDDSARQFPGNVDTNPPCQLTAPQPLGDEETDLGIGRLGRVDAAHPDVIIRVREEKAKEDQEAHERFMRYD